MLGSKIRISMVEFSSAVVDGASRYVVLKNRDTVYLSLDFDTCASNKSCVSGLARFYRPIKTRVIWLPISLLVLNDKIKIPRLLITSSPLWSTIPSSNARGNQL